MNVNELQSLPRYVFAGLVKLDILDLEFNNLTTLPDGLFAGLNLRFLGLEGNQLHTLRAGMFDALGGNLVLDLSHSALTTLEDGAFADLGDLVWLDLAHNWLRTLPTGVFAGLFNMRSLYLERNPGADFTFTMTIERVPNTNKVVIVVAKAAPFDMTTTISATCGTLPVGVSAVTVPVGHTKSGEIAITPLAGATASLGEAPPVPPRTQFDGIATTVGNLLVIASLRALSVEYAQVPALSVDDAQVHEGFNAVVPFAVTLNRPALETVTVDYVTSDGTAVAGEDYTVASGTLTFAAGETEKTVSVAELDDTHDERTETLSNASGASIEDGSATGTIRNSHAMPQAWFARFGRAVADQVMHAVEGRMMAARVPGTELSVVGQRVRGDVAVPEAANTRQAKAGLEALAHWVRGEEEDRTEAFASRQVTVRWWSWAVRPVPHVRRLECGETVHLRSGHREVRDMRAELASVGRRDAGRRYRPARPGADGPGSGRGDGRRR